MIFSHFLRGIEQKLPPESVLINNVAVAGKIPVSDKILEELKDGNYDLLLLSKHQQTKAQEFFFGDVPIRLLRARFHTCLVCERYPGGID